MEKVDHLSKCAVLFTYLFTKLGLLDSNALAKTDEYVSSIPHFGFINVTYFAEELKLLPSGFGHFDVMLCVARALCLL